MEFKKETRGYKNSSNQYRLAIANKHISERLTELGCCKNKTHIITFPSEEQVPKHLQRHFIRGYFDGDGDCTLNTSKSKVEKGVYIYSASYSLLCEFEFYMKKVGIKFNNIVKSGKNILIYKSVPSTISYKDYFNFLYKDATIYLQRKFDKFNNFVKQRRSTTIIDNPKKD